MKSDEMSEPKPGPTSVQVRLQALRTALLGLHKALVDSERVEYEKIMGKIQSPNHFLQLLVSDPWFAWLSPLSQLIVSVDEALDSETPLTEGADNALVKQCAELLVVGETGQGFPRHYFEALQRDPDVVLAHAQVAKLLGSRKSQS